MILKQRLQTEGLKRGHRLMQILGKQRGQYLYNILDSDDKKEHYRSVHLQNNSLHTPLS